MSKTKTLRKKTTGFDILYRVVTAILAVAMFPVIYFEKIIKIVFEHKEMSNILGTFLPQMKDDPGYTFFEKSFSEIVTMVDAYGNSEETTTFKEFFFKPELRPVWVAVGLLAVALIIALVILGFAIFSNTPKVVAGLSGAGFLFMIASYISFTNFFAVKVVEGTLKLSSLMNVTGLMKTAMDYLKVPIMDLGSAFFIVGALMLGILIWSASVIVVNKSDEKEKQLKKETKENA